MAERVRRIRCSLKCKRSDDCKECEGEGFTRLCPCGRVIAADDFDVLGAEPNHGFCTNCHREFDLDNGRIYRGGVARSKNSFWRPDQDAMRATRR